MKLIRVLTLNIVVLALVSPSVLANDTVLSKPSKITGTAIPINENIVYRAPSGTERLGSCSLSHYSFTDLFNSGKSGHSRSVAFCSEDSTRVTVDYIYAKSRLYSEGGLVDSNSDTEYNASYAGANTFSLTLHTGYLDINNETSDSNTASATPAH
ncbi:hypothetical protein [Cohnella phaseoli]|uniref:hypothetical protein n=1 Tax=Cohnella phaseoli TaxID=456490 RepID=UPI0011C06B09|nr:hypothetical protein [Cohnella phaseoli]